MKAKDLLKKMGFKTEVTDLDSELELEELVEDDDKTDPPASDKKEINVNIVTGQKKEKEDTTVNNKDKQEDNKVDLSGIKFENGKFSGLKTLTENDKELKALLESVNTYTDNKNAQEAINNAIKAELGKYDITKGISENIVINSVNKDGIKYVDGTVVGVEDAFKALAKDNDGMLKLKSADGDNNESKAPKAEGPALEGFSKDLNNNSNPLSDTDLVNFAFSND